MEGGGGGGTPIYMTYCFGSNPYAITACHSPEVNSKYSSLVILQIMMNLPTTALIGVERSSS